MTELINLTPHDIVLVDEEGHPLGTIPPSGKVARCNTSSEVFTTFAHDGIPIHVRRRTFTGHSNFLTKSPPKSGTYYIVSRILAEALPERRDLLIPDGVKRDDDGNIIGCTGFATLTEVDS